MQGKIVGQCLLKKLDAAQCIGGIDPVGTVTGDLHIEVPEKGGHNQFPGMFIKGAKDHGIRPCNSLVFPLILPYEKDIQDPTVRASNGFWGRSRFGRTKQNRGEDSQGSVFSGRIGIRAGDGFHGQCSCQQHKNKNSQQLHCPAKRGFGWIAFHGGPPESIFLSLRICRILPIIPAAAG